MTTPSPQLDVEEERRLTRAVVRGDTAALERFHSVYADPLYRFVYYRVGGSASETEDVVQETFLSALEGLHRFRGRSALFTWLCGIAKNRISRVRRKRSREQLASVLEGADPEIDRLLTQLDREELPDTLLEREETQDIVGATMASLPPRYQTVLVEKYVDSLPVMEMARRHSLTAKAVESTLTRARIAFRRTFELITGRLPGGATPHA